MASGKLAKEFESTSQYQDLACGYLPISLLMLSIQRTCTREALGQDILDPLVAGRGGPRPDSKVLGGSDEGKGIDGEGHESVSYGKVLPGTPFAN